MLDIKLLRDNPDKVKKGIASKGADPKLVDEFLVLDEQWRTLTKEIDHLRAGHKRLSEARDNRAAKEFKEQIKSLEEELRVLEEEREGILERIPNLPFEDVPAGKSEADNKILREVGKKPEFDFEPLDYLTIAEKLDLIDVSKAAEVAGSRFGYLKNEAVLLEFALIKLAFDSLIKEKFIPVVPPMMIRPEVYRGMGRLAGEQKEERYYLPKDDLYLIGSAEHTLGPLHKNEILEEKELPRRYAGFSSCFRREAGSYGKDTKGILRVHQFDKVEMFSFVRPEDSEKEHKFLLSLQERLMGLLELPYRVVEICTADMGWTDSRQYDIETWLPGQGKYRETHSASNTTDFQARGVNVKYRNKDKKIEFVHMLNATAFAVGRTLIAIIENYQTEDGKVKIPKILQEYVGKEIIG
jgi:seryl-tRNA synthetase